jgi:hypothetical protein
MRPLKLALLSVVMTSLLCLNSRVVRAQGTCGPVPPKPAVPSGCRDLVAQCICSGGVGSDHNQECHWEWICQH